MPRRQVRLGSNNWGIVSLSFRECQILKREIISWQQKIWQI